MGVQTALHCTQSPVRSRHDGSVKFDYMNSHTLQVVSVLAMSFLASCSTASRENPVPGELVAKVGIEGVPEARFWGDEWPRWSKEKFDTLSDHEIRRSYPAIYGSEHNYLAISGGGANGAYGAGLLGGWSATGTRPEFTMVTGISTGALSAPFAFLGEEYDALLREVYTTTRTEDVVKERNLVVAAFSDSLASTEPLKRLIAKVITARVLDEIAIEHNRGRRLFVGTMNLDAGRTVIWNIGAIANSDRPGKLDLVREILRASAAIPVAFPPVVIPVDYGGEVYTELHADGGTGSQVFVYPAGIDWRAVTRKMRVRGQPKVFVIRNAFLEPDHQGIKRRVLPIAGRTIESLIRTQGMGDIYQIFALCQRDGNDFHLGYIPSDFEVEPQEGFDPEYMTQLYDLGFSRAKRGYPWRKAPPGFAD